MFRLHLSTLVGFGHRPSGSTANEKDAVQYILQTVQEIKKMAPPSLKVEVDVQHPTVRLHHTKLKLCYYRLLLAFF